MVLGRSKGSRPKGWEKHAPEVKPTKTTTMKKENEPQVKPITTTTTTIKKQKPRSAPPVIKIPTPIRATEGVETTERDLPPGPYVNVQTKTKSKNNSHSDSSSSENSDSSGSDSEKTDNSKDNKRMSMFVATDKRADDPIGKRPIPQKGEGREDSEAGGTAGILSTPTGGSSKVPIFSLKDAENRLFDPYLGYNVELRHAFEFPSDVVAEDVYVHFGLRLERGRGNPRRDELAMGVKAVLREEFRKRYLKKHRKDGKENLHLKVYVVDVSEGDTETRMLAPECEIGLVRLCLAWFICTPDGSIVFDGGRIGLTDNMGYGMLDAFHLRTGLACLTNKMAPMLANQIMDRISIPSGRPFYQFW